MADYFRGYLPSNSEHSEPLSDIGAAVDRNDLLSFLELAFGVPIAFWEQEFSQQR
jgi:hypothetical protein